MPKYGLHRYHTFKYGRYRLSGTGGAGSLYSPHVAYRMRAVSPSGETTSYTSMIPASVPLIKGGNPRVRIRANDGIWQHSESAAVPGNQPRLRMRSTDKAGNAGQWVISERGTIFR